MFLDMSEVPLGSFKTPLGAIETNVVLAGLEAAAAIWVAWALLADVSLIPRLADQNWQWSFALWGIFLLLGVVVLGFAVEGLAGALERFLIIREGGWLRSRYNHFVPQPTDEAWQAGQRWIWKSPQASDEFARRRLRLLTGRNTACVTLLLMLSLIVGLPFARPDDWFLKLVIAVAAGIPATALFVWVYIGAHEAYNRAIQDSSNIGLP